MSVLSCSFVQYSLGVAAFRGGPGGAKLHESGSIFIRRVWFVVPDPPLVRRSLGVALWRVLPLLLAPERSDVEVVPCISHLIVAVVVDVVGTENDVVGPHEQVRYDDVVLSIDIGECS